MKKLYDLNYEESATEFAKLAKKYEADFEFNPVPMRPESDWRAAHFQVTHKSGFVAYYSRGTGTFSKAEIREAWRKTNWGCYMELDIAEKVASGHKKLKDKKIDADFCYALAKVGRPNITDILSSLFMDASDADQDFEDWAPELGYDPDSIKARTIWEQCNKVRRFLIKEIDQEDFEPMAILARQL